jgi:hypothetical protein
MNRIKLIITIIFICCGTLIADISKHDQTLLNELELLQLHELYIYKVNTLSKTFSETDLQFYKTKATLSQFKLDAIDGRGHGIDEVILLYKQLCLQQLTIWEHYRSFDYAAVNKVCKIMINKQNIQLLYWTENICRLQIEQLKSQTYDLVVLKNEPLQHALNKIEITVEAITKSMNLITAAIECLNDEMETTPVHNYTQRFGQNNFHSTVNQLLENNTLNKTELLIISAFTRSAINISSLLPFISQHIKTLPKRFQRSGTETQVRQFITYCQLLLSKKLSDRLPINNKGVIMHALYNPSITPKQKWPLLLTAIHYELLCDHLINCNALIVLANKHLNNTQYAFENIAYKKYLMALHQLAVVLKKEPPLTEIAYTTQLSNLLTAASSQSPRIEPFCDQLIFTALSDDFFSEKHQDDIWPEPVFKSLARTLNQTSESQSKRLGTLYNIYLNSHAPDAPLYGSFLFANNMLMLKTSQINTIDKQLAFISDINTIIKTYRNDVNKAQLRNGAIQSATYAYQIFSDNTQHANVAKASFAALFTLAPTDQINTMRCYYGNLLFHLKEYDGAYNEYAKVPLSDKHKQFTPLKMIQCQYLSYQKNQRALPFNTSWLSQLDRIIVQAKSQTIVTMSLLLAAKIAQEKQHPDIPRGLTLFTKHHNIWHSDHPNLLSEHLTLLKANNQSSTAIDILNNLPAKLNAHQQHTALKLLLSNRKEIQTVFMMGDNTTTAAHCKPTYILSQKLVQTIKDDPAHQYYLPAIQVALEVAITLAICDPKSDANKNNFHTIDTLLNQCKINGTAAKAFWYKLCVAKALYLKRKNNKKTLNDALIIFTNLRKQLKNSSNTTSNAYWWEAKTWEINCFLAQNPNSAKHKHQVNHAIDVLLNSHQDYHGPWRHYLKKLQTSVIQ